MSVTVHKLGEFIEEVLERNTEGRYGEHDLLGVNNEQSFCHSRANTVGINFGPYKVVRRDDFVYNPARLDIGSIAKFEGEACIVSTLYEVFRIKHDKRDFLLPEYLQVYFARKEFARYVGFKNWGSAREYFWLDAMKRTPISIPPIEEQRKAVEVWQGLRKMKEANEQLAEPLMQLCRSYLEECKKKWPMTELGPMIHLVDETNLSRRELPVVGVNFQKEFMPTAANMDGIDTAKYKVMTKDRFVFSGMQTGRDVCIRIGLWDDETDALMSPAYSTFEVCDTRLLPEYLFLWFKRSEVDRLGWFYSDSSVRANLDWNRFCAIKIPLPPLEVQQAIVDVYRCASEAKKIAAEADGLSRAVCPALVRGAGKGNRPDGAGRSNTGNRPDGAGRSNTGNRPDGAGRSNAPEEGCLTAGRSNTPEEGCLTAGRSKTSKEG